MELQEGVILQKGQKIRMSQIFLNFSRTSENHTTKIRRSQGPDVSYFNLPEHEWFFSFVVHRAWTSILNENIWEILLFCPKHTHPFLVWSTAAEIRIRLLNIVWPQPIWIKVRSSWQIPPQHQSTYLGGPESASIEIPPFRPFLPYLFCSWKKNLLV